MATYINLKEAQKWLLKKDLSTFLKEMWETFEPASFVDCWLIDWQCECFMYSVKHFLPKYVWDEWITDEQYNRLKLDTEVGICPVRDKLFNGRHVRNHDWNMPPRHSKTSIIGVCGPTWLSINSPISVATVSHSSKLSSETNEKRLRLLQSEKFSHYFYNEMGTRLSKQSAINIKLRNGSQMYATVQVSFTGFGADVIIADDLISSDNAVKDMQVLKNVRSFYRNTLPTRLNTKETGVIWQVQQRLAPGDISGMIADDPALRSVYSHTELQAIAEKDQILIYPCSGRIKEVHKGDCLWPERFGDYTQLKAETGPIVFDTQYQQNAKSTDLTIIKQNMIHYIDEEEYENFKLMAEIPYASHDCPVKDKESNDLHGFVGGWGRGNELVIDEGWEEHLGYVKQKELMTVRQQIQPSIIQVIEDKANGSALLQDLRSEVPGLIAFEPGTNSKRQRLELASVYMASGAVRFVKNDKTEYLIKKLLEFPFLDHDDVVDAFSQLVIYHFNQRKAGVYVNSFTYQNIVKDVGVIDERNNIYGVTMANDLIKIMCLNIQNDKYVVIKEWLLRGIEKFEEFFKTEFKSLPLMIDCSYENVLSKLVKGIPITAYKDERREESTHSLKVGFYKKKVLVYKECSQTINDITKLRLSATQLDKGRERVDTFDEGLSGVLRLLLQYYRGTNAIW